MLLFGQPKPIRCLYCFKEFTLSNAPFRCINNNCPSREPDPIYAQYQGLPERDMGHVFSVEKNTSRFRRIPRSANCPSCGYETTKRLCPHCHFELPTWMGQTQQRIIAVIGERGSGKSNYIAVLVNELRRHVGPEFKLAMFPVGDSTKKRYNEDFFHPLFEENRIIPPTLPVHTNADIKQPMIFRLTLNRGRAKNLVANLVLFDTAGEDMHELDVLSTEARYICHADALIFLLDPLQMNGVRRELETQVHLPLPPYMGVDLVTLVGRLHELYERVLGLKPGERIKKPVAFAMSKIDALESIISPDSGLFVPSNYGNGMLDLIDINSIHTEMEAFLDAWEGKDFRTSIESLFENYHFFGVSALGSIPNGNHHDVISPIRVADPLLWILHKFKLIQGNK